MRKKKELTNLEKDVIRAKKLGYSSYGKYKVDYPNTRDEDSIIYSKDTIRCRHCGERFLPKRKGNIFCSNRCRDNYHGKRKAEAKRIAAAAAH